MDTHVTHEPQGKRERLAKLTKDLGHIKFLHDPDMGSFSNGGVPLTGGVAGNKGVYYIEII